MGLHLPLGVNRKQVVSEGEYPIVQANAICPHRHGAETKERAVEKPNDYNYPDKRGNQVFRLFFHKGEDEEEDHRTQCHKHDAVLDKEGFYDEGLGCHGVDIGLPHSLQCCQLPAKKQTCLLTVERRLC